MIKISKEFGMIVVTKDDTEVLRTNKLENLSEYCESISHTLTDETVEIETYASDQNSLFDACDLLLIAFVLTWGNALYDGDSIQIKAQLKQCPENK